MTKTVRWGIIGTGRMAATIAGELAALSPQGFECVAVASRDLERARSFAAQHGVRRGYDSVERLVEDAEVDAVYVATPHSRHATDMLACIAAGKPVLCEKPFTLDAAEAERVVNAAQSNAVPVMEAMWTRFLPAVVALRRMLAEGEIGTVRLLVGGGAFIPRFDPTHYLFDPTLGGGVLLDAGVYLVSLASLVLGSPQRVLASGRLGATGVDEQDAILLDYGSASAMLYVSLQARRPPDFEILGEAGRIRLEPPVFRPTRLTIWDERGEQRIEEHPVDGSGYGPQLVAFAEAVSLGKRECATMPLAETVAIMRTLDAVRAQVGLHYPDRSSSH
jgi:predicted dehydrogenase